MTYKYSFFKKGMDFVSSLHTIILTVCHIKLQWHCPIL